MDQTRRPKRLRKYHIFFITLWGFALLLSAWSFAREIQKNHDERLSRRIEAASGTVNSFVSSRYKLPESLEEAGVTDKEDIIYKKVDNKSYEMCGTFKTLQSNRYGYASRDAQEVIYIYAHSQGYQCFNAEPYVLRDRDGVEFQPPVIRHNQFD